jgi:hypothetical protein
MDGVEVFAEENARFVWLDCDDVHALLVYLVPYRLGVAAKGRHIDFIVDVADTIHEREFVFDEFDFLVLLEFGGAIWQNIFETLRVFSHAGWAVEYCV